MYGSFNNIEIKGICSAVPSTIEHNDIYTKMIGDRRAKKQIKLTGVRQRHISTRYQKSSDLCWAATQKLLSHLKWNKDDIKVLIFITQGPDFLYPSTAFLFHKRLELPKDCLCFDMNLGCSSFNVGMQNICALMQTLELGNKGLLLVGDTAATVKSPHKAYKDDEIAHDMLFGSEGSCIALEKVEHSDILFMNMSDGNGYQAIIGRAGEPSKMDGSAVFSFAINDVANTVNEFIDRFKINKEDSFFVFHQAQKLILDNIIDSCHIPPESELRSLEEYGNTSGGSVPLTLCCNSEVIKADKKKSFLLCGFGVGLSWGCIYANIQPENILPIIEYDECFEHRPFSRLLSNKKVVLADADNDLGEWISRYLYDSNAELKLIGTEESILKDICSRMPNKSEYSLSSVIESVNDCEYGIVFINGIKKDDLCLVCDRVVEDSEDSDMSPVRIVVLEKASDISTYGSIVDSMQNWEQYSDHISINVIQYDETKLRIKPIHDAGQAWIENYIEEGCPDELVKASYIAANIVHFLAGTSKYTNNSVIRIS